MIMRDRDTKKTPVNPLAAGENQIVYLTIGSYNLLPLKNLVFFKLPMLMFTIVIRPI